MPLFDWTMQLPQITLTLGLLICAALVAGALGQWVRLPRVTSYLLAGVVLGPSVLNLVPHQAPHDHVASLQPITKLAIALVLFQLGCHFPLVRIRRIARHVLGLSAGDLGVGFLLVTSGLLLIGAGWQVAVLLGALAVATAPATTILVLKETESEGNLTEYANALVALNNLASIVLFELLFMVVLFWNGTLAASPVVELVLLGRDLAGSVLLGILGGLLVSYFFPLVPAGQRLTLLIGLVTLLLGACLAAETPYLLTFLAMGVMVANSSEQVREVLAEMDRVLGLLCVVFFVTHGAELELGKLWEAGLLGVGYLVLRSAGKYLGIRLAARRQHEEPAVQRWLGAALVAQAGAAIALSAIAVDHPSVREHAVLLAICEQVQTVILGTVVVFEIAGPLLIRHAVLQAGEVPLVHAVQHRTSGPLDQLVTVWNRLLSSLGRNPWARYGEADLSVGQIMRRNVKTVPRTATFDELIACIEQSRDNTFPVVDEAGSLVGVIRYRELSHALFDRSLGPLVRAEDVTTPAGRVLRADEPLSRASAIFAASKDDCIPVVGDDGSRFLGVVRRKDVFRLLVRERREGT